MPFTVPIADQFQSERLFLKSPIWQYKFSFYFLLFPYPNNFWLFGYSLSNRSNGSWNNDFSSRRTIFFPTWTLQIWSSRPMLSPTKIGTWGIEIVSAGCETNVLTATLHCLTLLKGRGPHEGRNTIYVGKVHILWEGHKILQNLPLTFDCMYCSKK